MTDRLTHAVAAGGLDWPADGRLLLIGPGADDALPGVAPERCVVVQGNAPDHAALVARGLEVHAAPETAGDGFAAAVVWVPRSRPRATAWLAAAVARLAPGGLLVVTGAKTDGIDAQWRACRGLMDDAATVTKAHGRVFWGRPRPGWPAPPPPPAPVDGFAVPAGGFSADGVDPGSAALAAALPERLSGSVADLGAGWGWLSAQILRRPGVSELHLVESDADSLAAARANIADPRARFHWADARLWRPAAALDAVVTNPPFHAARRPDPSLGKAFIAAAAEMLAPRGTLWLVANRHLPYEAELNARFQAVAEIDGTPGYKILRAERPRGRRS